MSWVVAIDESGNLGSSTRYFVMAAIIIRRPRNLKSAYERLPRKKYEPKFYNSTDEEVISVLKEIAKADVTIVTSIVDKHNYRSRFFGIHGNELYKMVLEDLLQKTAYQIPNSDVLLFLDRCSFVSMKEFRSLATRIMNNNGCQMKKCEKKLSDQTPCILLVDYVAGAIYHMHSCDDATFFNIIKEKIVTARTD